MDQDQVRHVLNEKYKQIEIEKSKDQKYYTCQKRNQIPPFDPPSFVHAASSLHSWAAGRQVSTQGHG